MTRRRSRAYLFACTVTGVAVLLTAYNGNPSWMLLLAFVFVAFPSWRGRAYRLAEKWLTRNAPDA